MTSTLPFVSVIMPVRNEGDFLQESLGAVLAQDYPHARLEILVADGMSTDTTRDIVRELARTSGDVPVLLVDNPLRIVATGLNLALGRARGEIIVRVDGHCKIARDYVSCCVRHLMKGDIVGVGGPIQTIAKTSIGRAVAAAMSSKFGVGGSAFRTTRGRTLFVDTIAFPAYTRAAIDRAGAFDEELVRNQDDEYNYRLRKMGGRLLLAADVRSEYYSRESLRKLYRQYFQYGVYKVRVMQKHPRQMRPRQFAPPTLVLVILASALASPLSTIARTMFFGVLSTYVLMVLIASMITARGLGWRQVPLLAATFPGLHLSYGFGFLVGLANAARRLFQLRRSSQSDRSAVPVPHVSGSEVSPIDR